MFIAPGGVVAATIGHACLQNRGAAIILSTGVVERGNPGDLATVVTAETQDPFGFDEIGSAAMIDLIGETTLG